MATYSSVRAWRIPGTGDPGGLPSMGSHRVGHNWRNLAAAAANLTIKKSEHWKNDPQTVVLEKTLESPLDSKEIRAVNPKGSQSWIFIEMTDDEAKASIFWPPDARKGLIGKNPDAGKDWKQKEKGMTEDEMVGWHDQLNGYKFEQTLGDGEGQGSLATTVHGVTKSRTRLSNWTTNLKEGFPCWLSGKYCMNAVQSLDQKEPLEKEITTHSSVLAWETPWTKEPGGLQFMRSQQHWTQLSD